MSPVTSQGIRAQATMNARVQGTLPLIRKHLAQGELSPASLVSAIEAEPAEVVREAMWQLIEDEIIELTPDMHLRLRTA